MKKISFLCLLVFWVLSTNAQTVSITDQETGEPIIFATLTSKTPVANAITDASGKANIAAFKGAQKIEIRYIGYTDAIRSFDDLQANGFKLELTPSSIMLDDVVVSANRWSQRSGEVPSKIVSLSPREVSLQNPQTAADMLNITGNVFIQKSQQGGGSPMIRGFATNRLLYTVDGVRMNTAIFRGGNIQNVISLDPFGIEHTEVFFGPGSVIYGSDAIGGVMSFQTLKPTFSENGKTIIDGAVQSRYATANQEKTGHAHIGLGWGKWALTTSVSFTDYGDLRMGSRGPDDYLNAYFVDQFEGNDIIRENPEPEVQIPSGYSQLNLMQKISYRPNEKWEFNYGFHYSETSEYARYDRHIRYNNGLPRYGEWSYGPQKWMMNNLNISYSKEHLMFDDLSIRLAQQFFEESRYSRDIFSVNREIRIEEVDAYSANLDFVKTTSEKNKIFYGLETVWNKVNSAGINENISTNESVGGPSRYPQANWISYGAYISDQFKLSDIFLLQAGLRYNRVGIDAQFDTNFYPIPFTETKLSDGALTGSIGVVHRPTDKWMISANLATAFRSPNVDDMGKVFDSEPGAVVVPNPDLKAEYAYNVDFSIARVIGKTIKIDATAYYTILENAMVRRDFMLNGQDSILYDGSLSRVQAIQNAAVAKVYGVQAGIEVKLPMGFGLRSNFNYQVGEEELNDGSISPSRHAPPWYGTTRLSYQTKKLSLQLYAMYNGEKAYENMPESEKGKAYLYAKDENGNPYSPSWYTLNFKASFRFSKQLELNAGLENITDQRYRPYSSGMAGAGRNGIVAVKFTF